MADPEATAKNVLAILGQIDDRLSSISNKVGQITAAGNSFGGAVGGGAGGGNGAATGAAGGSGGSGGGLGLASLPGSSSSSGGGGSGQNNLGLGRVAVQAAGSALAGSLSRFGSDRVSSAISNQVLANSFSIRSGIPVSNYLFGKQLFKGAYGYSSQDLSQGQANLASLATPGSALYKQLSQQSGQESLRQAGVSYADNTNFLRQTRTPGTYNTLRLYGINGLTNGGASGANSQQLASSILQRAGSSVRGNDQALTAALAPGGALDNLLNQAGITGSNRAQVETELHAQITGRTGQLTKTADTSTKQRATSAANKNLRTDQGVAQGAADINQAATKLNQAADAILGANQSLADTIGEFTGASQQSGSKAAGVATAAAHLAHSRSNSSSRNAAAQAKVRAAAQKAGTGGPGSSPRGLGGAAAGGGTGSGATKTASLRHVWPVGPGGITQAFGAGTAHHPGVDFGRTTGTPIHAAADGDVIFAGSAQGFGDNFVAIFHPGENKVTRYGHGSAKYVGTGDKVVAGQVIAAVGMEGYATGPHLHLELANGSNAFGGYLNNLDPIPWLGGAGTSTSTAADGSNTSSSSSSGSTSASSATPGQSGFGTVSLSEGLTSSLLQGGGVSAMGAISGGSNSGSNSSSGSSNASSGGSGTAKSLGGSVSNPANEKLANQMMAKAGWTAAGIAKVDAIWTQESGFNQFAQNPSGGPYNAAYGIPQSDPGSKMASAGADWLTNPATQIAWGIAYINSRYGGPDKAYATKAATGTYAQGAWELERDENARVHKGEMIIPKGPAEQLRRRAGGGGGNVTIHVHLRDASNAEAMRLVQTVKTQLDKQDMLSTLGST